MSDKLYLIGVILLFLISIFTLRAEYFMYFTAFITICIFCFTQLIFKQIDNYFWKMTITYIITTIILFFLSLEHLFYIWKNLTKKDSILKNIFAFFEKITSYYYFRQPCLYLSITVIFVLFILNLLIENNINTNTIIQLTILYGVLVFITRFAFNQTIKTSVYYDSSDKIKNDLTIVHLSDTHNEIFTNKFLYSTKNKNNFSNELLIDLVKKEKPDLIVMSGDMFDEVSDFYKPNFLYDELKDIASMFYTIGNHEVATKERKDEYIKKLVSSDVIYLEDTHIKIKIKDDEIIIAGLKDPRSSKISPMDRLIKIEKEIDVNDKDLLKLLLSHRPELTNEYKNSSFNYVFSGHAHGGQVIIPFTKRGIIAPHQGLLPKYTGGTHKLDKDTTLVISRGLKISGIPRINNPPELVILKIKGNKKGNPN